MIVEPKLNFFAMVQATMWQPTWNRAGIRTVQKLKLPSGTKRLCACIKKLPRVVTKKAPLWAPMWWALGFLLNAKFMT